MTGNQSSTVRRRRVLTPPTVEEIVEIGARDWLDVSQTEAEELEPAISELLAIADELLSLPSAHPAQSPLRRSSGRRPTADEDPFNVFACLCEVDGRDEGPLAGRSVGIKDNIDVAGVPTGNASPTLPYTPTTDAVVVERILAAGGRIVGKLNMDDYASGATGETSVHGPPLNPIDVTRSAGGSSGGSGAALRCSAVDFALGGDQGGSARIPASFCGVVALKATHGLIPSHGMTHLGHTIDYVCPMARSVNEVGVLLEVIAGDDWRDPQWVRGSLDAAESETELSGDDLSGLKVGVVRESVLDEICEAAVIANLTQTAAVLEERGAVVEEVSVPLWEYGAHITQTILSVLAGEMIRSEGEGRDHLGLINLERLDSFAVKRRSQGSLFPPYIKTWLIAGRYMQERYFGRPYGVLHNLRLTLRQNLDRALASCDVLLTPTTPTTAPRLLAEGVSGADKVQRVLGSIPYNTASLNLSGHPALAVPNGVDGSGLPTSAQIVGRRFDEARVLAVGRAVEVSIKDEGGDHA